MVAMPIGSMTLFRFSCCGPGCRWTAWVCCSDITTSVLRSDNIRRGWRTARTTRIRRAAAVERRSHCP